jgi:hypothetical protein
LTHERDLNKGLLLFLLAYRALTHETTAWCSGHCHICPVTCCLGLLPVRRSP